MWMDLLSSFLQKLLELVIVPLVLGVIGLAGAWLMQKIKEARAKLTNEQNWIIDNVIDSAVLAAEQVGLNEEITDKQIYAIDVAEKALASRGIKLELDEIVARIEAAVFAQFNRNRKPVE